jgi:cytochrome c551/c552
MNETLFYVFGIALVVSAVGISVIGLRFENFPPSRGVLAGTVLYFAVLVGLTAVFAVFNAQDEQAAREAEQAAESQGAQTTTGGTQATTTANASAGKQVFDANGCGSCHTLKAAGSSGMVGPDLDEGLKGKTASFIRQSIVDPNAEITPGFPPDTMPQNFGQAISPGDLNALIAFLVASTGAKQ